jgi:hypothetical protein
VPIEPIFNSPPRPRRKQKINREQNREVVVVSDHNPAAPSVTTADRRSYTRMDQHFAAAAAAMVFPMPQNQDRNVNMDTAANLAAVSPIASSLTRSIYNQVNNLISEHEERPEQLARIFRNLQDLSTEERLGPSAAAGNNRDATEAAAIPRFVPLEDVPPLPSSNNAYKSEKRFSVSRPGTEEAEAEMEPQQFPSIRNSLNLVSRQDQSCSNVVRGEEAAGDSLRRNDNGGAVPKNVQRNLKASPEECSSLSSRVLHPREMPKNMQEACGLPQADALLEAASSQHGHDGARAVHRHHEAAAQQVGVDEQQQLDGEVEGDDDEEESEIPEADQGHSPEHSAQYMGDMSSVEAEGSNDQEVDGAVAAVAAVSPSALEQLIEDANMRNLVDEVLLEDSSADPSEEEELHDRK